MSGVTMHVRLKVTESDRALITRAAKQAGWSVSQWATVNLIQLAEIETMNPASATADFCPPPQNAPNFSGSLYEGKI